MIFASLHSPSSRGPGMAPARKQGRVQRVRPNHVPTRQRRPTASREFPTEAPMVEIPLQIHPRARRAQAANAPYEQRDQGLSEAILGLPRYYRHKWPHLRGRYDGAYSWAAGREQQVSTLHAMLAAHPPPSLPIQPCHTPAAPLPPIIPSFLFTE